MATFTTDIKAASSATENLIKAWDAVKPTKAFFVDANNPTKAEATALADTVTKTVTFMDAFVKAVMVDKKDAKAPDAPATDAKTEPKKDEAVSLWQKFKNGCSWVKDHWVKALVITAVALVVVAFVGLFAYNMIVNGQTALDALKNIPGAFAQLILRR